MSIAKIAPLHIVFSRAHCSYKINAAWMISNYKKETSSKDVQFYFGFKRRTSFKSTKRLHALAFRSDTVEIKCQSPGSGIGNEAYKLSTLWGGHQALPPVNLHFRCSARKTFTQSYRLSPRILNLYRSKPFDAIAFALLRFVVLGNS